MWVTFLEGYSALAALSLSASTVSECISTASTAFAGFASVGLLTAALHLLF